MESEFRTKIVSIDIPADANIIFGHSHFIKTIEDLYEALITSSPTIEFGIAFCEASQQRLIRTDGNSEAMTELAEKAAYDVACGHSFFIFLKNSYPINVLDRIKQVQEVVRIFCATANPLEVVVAETGLGRGVLGVIDGEPPLGVESEKEKAERNSFLRTIGYKR